MGENNRRSQPCFASLVISYTELELRDRGHEYMNYREFEQKNLKECK